MVAVRKRAPLHITLSEFLAWEPADPSGECWQLLDVVPVAMAPGSETHAALQAEIGRLIANHLVDNGGPCRLLSQPGIVPAFGPTEIFVSPIWALPAPRHRRA